MKPEPTIEQAIKIAVDDLNNALLENIAASRAETEVKMRKNKAYHILLKAKERMRAIEQQMMESI